MVVPAERDISNLREDVSHLANRHLAHPCPLPPFLLSSSSFLVCSFLCFKVSHLGTTLYSLASPVAENSDSDTCTMGAGVFNGTCATAVWKIWELVEELEVRHV